MASGLNVGVGKKSIGIRVRISSRAHTVRTATQRVITQNVVHVPWLYYLLSFLTCHNRFAVNAKDTSTDRETGGGE